MLPWFRPITIVPELEMAQNFNPENDGYSAGYTEVVYSITKSSGAGSWSFTYTFERTNGTLSLYGGSPSATGSVNVSGNSSTITFFVNNDPGNSIDLKFTITGTTGQLDCTAGDRIITNTILSMPSVGSFTE